MTKKTLEARCAKIATMIVATAALEKVSLQRVCDELMTILNSGGK